MRFDLYADWYLRHIIGVRYTVKDSPQPAIDTKDGNDIYLPVSTETLWSFLGAPFVQNASKELLFAVITGLVYHETAHVLSGEDHDIEPYILNNLINESNDFTVVPARFPGAIPYTLALVNLTYLRGSDIAGLPMNTREDRLAALMEMSIMFLRKLRIRYGGQDVRKLPDDHPLQAHLDQMKPILLEARRCTVEERPPLVKKLHDIFREFWDKQPQESDATFEDGLVEAKKVLASRQTLGEGDLEPMERLIGKRRGEIRHQMERIAREVDKEQEESISSGHSHQDGAFTIEEETRTGKPPRIDQHQVGKIRRILRPLLFSRTLARRAASVVGTGFHPARFYEIKTSPEGPRLRRDLVRIKRQIDESLVIMCFDRSSSMREGDKSKTCQEVAATMYEALSGAPRCDVRLLGFNEAPVLIKGVRPLPVQTVHRRIPVALSPSGGTDLPLALSECLRLARSADAHVKLVQILTDGDLDGRFAIEDVVEQAHRDSIDVMCIGVKGADEGILLSVFGPNRAVYVENVRMLGVQLQEAILKHA